MKSCLLASIFFTAFTLITASVKAQQTYLTPKFGLSLFNSYLPDGYYINYYEKNPTSSGSGITGGAALEIGVLKNNLLAIQPEVLIVQKGFEMGEYNPRLYRMNYLEMPLLFKSTIRANRFNFFINAGPSLGVGINGRIPGSDSKILFRKGDREDISVYPRADFSLQAGGGVGYRIGSTILLLEVRYGRGFRKLTGYPGVGNYGFDFYTRFVLLNAGLAIPLGKE